MKLKDYLTENYISDVITLEDDEGNIIDIHINISKKNVTIQKNFKFQGKIYKKNTKFPKQLQKYVLTTHDGLSYEEHIKDTINLNKE